MFYFRATFHPIPDFSLQKRQKVLGLARRISNVTCTTRSAEPIDFRPGNRVKLKRTVFSPCRLYTRKRTRACRTTWTKTRTFQRDFTRFDFIDGNTFIRSETIEMNNLLLPAVIARPTALTHFSSFSHSRSPFTDPPLQ